MNVSVMGHLKSICDHEKEIYESKLKLQKMRLAKQKVEREVEAKHDELQEMADKKGVEVCLTERSIKQKKEMPEPTLTKALLISATVLIITIVLQMLVRFLVVDVGSGYTLETVTSNFAIVYAIVCLAIFFIVKTAFENGWGALLTSVIIFGIFIGIRYAYMDSALAKGYTTNEAVVRSYILFDSIEVAIAAFCCWRYKVNADEDYYHNTREIKSLSEKLPKMKTACDDLLNDVNVFDKKSNHSLSLMQQDIQAMENHIKTVQTRLNAIYSQRVLHPQYHNWVAAATIYEYLDIGRCYELRGPEGAYNLYEKELMAKKILDSLSAINSSISNYGSAIVQSQQYIRAQLSECNRNVEQLVVKKYDL